MPNKASEDRFSALLQQIADILLEAVRKGMGDKPWILAFHEERQAAADSGARFSKLRVQLPGVSELKTVHAPFEAGDLMDEVWKIKDDSANPWYGLKLTFYPDGKYEAEYDYDPKWKKGFFKS